MVSDFENVSVAQSPKAVGGRATYGQFGLSTLLVIVSVIGVNLAIFQSFSAGVGVAAVFVTTALALHFGASHIGRQALRIGSDIGPLHRQATALEGGLPADTSDDSIQAVCGSAFDGEEAGDCAFRRLSIPFAERNPEPTPIVDASRATNDSPLILRCMVYISSCWGILLGPWVSFQIMNQIDANVAHPLAVLAICVAGALLGAALLFMAIAALRLLGTAIHFLRYR